MNKLTQLLREAVEASIIAGEKKHLKKDHGGWYEVTFEATLADRAWALLEEEFSMSRRVEVNEESVANPIDDTLLRFTEVK